MKSLLSQLRQLLSLHMNDGAWSMKHKASSVKHGHYPGGLQVLPELIHSGVGDAHVSEHPFQFGGELTATFRLQIEYEGTFE